MNTRLINSFIKYVKVDSLSREEGKFASLIKKELRGIGLKCIEDKASNQLNGQSGNLYVGLKANIKGAPRIMFNAHLDTVPPGKGIKPRIKKGRIVSDGNTILGADNKAGVAVIMEALKLIKEKDLPHGNIDVIFTVAEELGLCGSKFIDRKFLKADMGFVLDGGDVDEIINKAPSQDSIVATIIGRAAHAGVHPEHGINAIKVASGAISRMKLGRIDRETTANIGMISGGIATNIIPEKVTIKGEARSHNLMKLKKQVLHMKQVLLRECKKNKAKLELAIRPAYRSFEVPVGSLPMKIAREAAKDIGIKPVIKATGGGSDANIFFSFGLPCLILGVGADKVHTVKENASISQMTKGVELVLNIIKKSVKCSKEH